MEQQTVLNQKYDFPTEIISLPSKGLLYKASNPLSKGTVEMRYMTAKHEDILTNESYIKSGIVLDKLLEALVVDEINLDDLLIGDKNALLVAARILGYGKDYSFNYKHPLEEETKQVIVDLALLKDKELEREKITEGINRFSYTLSNGDVIDFKLLTQRDEKAIEDEIKNLKKLYKNQDVSESLIRLRNTIISVNGSSSKEQINNYLENKFLARLAREFRKAVTEVTPDVDLKFTFVGDKVTEEGVSIPLGVSFFWPDAGT